MKTLSSFMEAKVKKAVFVFGRFNPPTTGHDLLIEKLLSVAKSHTADPFIFTSTSQDAKKNPLEFNDKIDLLRKIYSNKNSNLFKYTTLKPNNPFIISSLLYEQGYREVLFLVGSDRVQGFQTLLKYNGVDNMPHGYYNFDNLQIVSAGERDPDADDISGMSASKLRKHALAGQYDQFSKGMSSKLTADDIKKTYDKIRQVMHKQIKENNSLNAIRDLVYAKVVEKQSPFLMPSQQELQIQDYKANTLSEEAYKIFKSLSEQTFAVEVYLLKNALKYCNKLHEIYYSVLQQKYATQTDINLAEQYRRNCLKLLEDIDGRSGIVYNVDLKFLDTITTDIIKHKQSLSEIIAKKIKKEKVLEDGTDELVDSYKNMTPGQEEADLKTSVTGIQPYKTNVKESFRDVQMISNALMNAAVTINRLEKEISDKLQLNYNVDFKQVRASLKRIKDKIYTNKQTQQTSQMLPYQRRIVGPQYREFK